MESVADLLKEVGTSNGTTMEPDRLGWRHSKEGSITVTKLYKTENSIMEEEYLRICSSSNKLLDDKRGK